MGIMMPITMSGGMQRAHQDNQEDQRFDMIQESHGKEMQGLDLGMRRDRQALDEAERDAPLKDMERKARTSQMLATQGVAMLQRKDLPPENRGPLMAKILTDIPLYGGVEYRDGKFYDGQTEFSMDEAYKIMVNLTDPDEVAKAARANFAERQYVVGDKVMTMTPQQAATVQGARRFDDVNAGVSLGKSTAEVGNINAQALEREAQAGKHAAETRWIGPMAQADINATNALAGERRASAAGKGRDEVDKNRKAIRDEVDFVTRQIRESGSPAFTFMGDVDSLEGLDADQRQSVAARMEQIQGDAKASAYERQIASRYVELMQVGGYLDSDDESAAADAAKSEYASLVKQFGRGQARAILARRGGSAGDPRNR